MVLDKYSIRLRADHTIWSRSNILSPVSRIVASMKLDVSGNWWAIPASQLSWWVMEKYDNRRHCGSHYSRGSAIQLTAVVTDRFRKASENAIWYVGSMPISGYWVGSDIERGKRLRVRRAILCHLYGVMFQIMATRKKKKRKKRKVIANGRTSWALVLPTLGSVMFITIVFEKQDIWWITSLISSGASTSLHPDDTLKKRLCTFA